MEVGGVLDFQRFWPRRGMARCGCAVPFFELQILEGAAELVLLGEEQNVVVELEGVEHTQIDAD